MKAIIYSLVFILVGMFLACLVGFDIIADVLREVMK